MPKKAAAPAVKEVAKPKKNDGLPEVSMEDIASGDVDIENPLAVIFGQKHPEIMQKYAVRQYDDSSFNPSAQAFLQEKMEEMELEEWATDGNIVQSYILFKEKINSNPR